jgi:hypothetical protein
VDSRESFELSYDASHRGAVVMDLGLFHASLPVLVAEEFQHFVEGLTGIVEDVGKSAALSVLEKVFARDSHHN